ncbi:hypothetical protein [Ancylobacter lacus]|uniref:hypothetical protein n=1 Tax=Ancylobacter lacus TaxID=2579970 RepID=UPI001BCAA99B|nr:hypothetical protein [Ancylobacter lacus]MBS7538071.1 hypothetical protein [Ancylobacter lacus]
MLDFAILAPLAAEHLESGQKIAETTGFVAFGSMKWELFSRIESLRGEEPVPVLMYASDHDVPEAQRLRVSWTGFYIGFVLAKGGAHPAGMSHRPPTTAKYAADNSGHWAVFWHVVGLKPVPVAHRPPISALRSIKGGWRKDAPPRGPELVATPARFETLFPA